MVSIRVGMKNSLKIIGALLVLSLSGQVYAANGTGASNPGAGVADGYSEAGTRAAEFLTIPVGSRGVAMGGAYGAAADEVSAVWWNPAGLAFVGESQVLLSVYDLPLDVQYTFGAAALPLVDGRLVLGGFLGVLSVGEQEITTVTQPQGTGVTFDSYSLQGGISAAWNFSDRFSAGVNVKLVHESIAENTQSTLAFDLGTNYHTVFMDRKISLAFFIRNLGGNLTYDGEDLKTTLPAEEIYPGENIARQDRDADLRAGTYKLPTSFHISLAYDLLKDENIRWLAVGEFSQNNNMPASCQLGTELTRKLNNKASAALRCGWDFRRDEVDLRGSDKLRGLSAGGGINYDLFSFTAMIDYAYRNWGRLNATHQFSLGIAF